MQKAMSFNDAAIIYFRGSAYRSASSKDDPISTTNSSNLVDKKAVF